jgi:hypothetical protein
VVIGVGDEPGEDLHHPGVQPPLVVRQRVPLRHVRVTRGQLSIRSEQAELLLALEDDLAVVVPAHVELALVPVGPLGGDVVGSVGRAPPVA